MITAPLFAFTACLKTANKSISWKCAINIQLFREWLSEKVHATIPKLKGRVVLNSLFFKGVWKNDTRGHGCLRVLKESNKSRFNSHSVRNNVLIVSRIVACTFFPTTFSRNSCITLENIHSRGQPASMQIYDGNKEIFCTRKESYSRRKCLEHQYGRFFSVPFPLLNFYFTLLHLLLYDLIVLVLKSSCWR